jgi:hypothetical protein
MKQKRYRTYIIFGLILFAIVIALSALLAQKKVQSLRQYDDNDAISPSVETISDAPIPMASPQAIVDEAAVVIPVTSEQSARNAAEPVRADSHPAAAAAAAQTPVPEEPSGSEAAPAARPEEPTPSPAPDVAAPPTPTPEPTPTPAPVKAQKPDDISNVSAMAKYLFHAATEFWAVEKDFSGTTTRPVSTRVAASIGAGTAVDCPGGDTVRIDKDGKAHDSYAIADHFRDYVDMPDLQYFKIYLSEKDYTVNPYGAREEVIGSYYQYGSERASYMAKDDEDGD